MEPGLPAVVAPEQAEAEEAVVGEEVAAEWAAQGREPDLVATVFALNAGRRLLTRQASPAPT